MTSPGIVVVGGGAAGHAVIAAVRARDPGVALTLVCGRSAVAATWCGEQRVRVCAGLRAADLRPAAHRMRLDDGELLAYERAVLCTGETALARCGGLVVVRVIVVDARMRTSAAGVLAAGACTGSDASLAAQADAVAGELLGAAPALAAA